MTYFLPRGIAHCCCVKVPVRCALRDYIITCESVDESRLKHELSIFRFLSLPVYDFQLLHNTTIYAIP